MSRGHWTTRFVASVVAVGVAAAVAQATTAGSGGGSSAERTASTAARVAQAPAVRADPTAAPPATATAKSRPPSATTSSPPAAPGPASATPGGGPTILAGSVDLIDAADTTGAIGLGGEAGLAPDTVFADAFLPIAGRLTQFRVYAFPAADGGTLTFTVEINDIKTAITCTISAPSRSCADLTHAVSASAGALIAVLVGNSTGAFVRDARWTAAY
jgi:hypothetical protein